MIVSIILDFFLKKLY